MSKSYEDILHLPHPVSKKHKPMPITDRAAQFSPFAALTGHGAAICETARITDSMIFLSEEEKQAISKTLCMALESNASLSITYFEPDAKKAGGSYQVFQGVLRRIDTVEKLLIFKGDEKLPIDWVVQAELTE